MIQKSYVRPRAACLEPINIVAAVLSNLQPTELKNSARESRIENIMLETIEGLQLIKAVTAVSQSSTFGGNTRNTVPVCRLSR